MAEEGRDGGQHDAVRHQLPIVAEDRHVREEAVLLAQLGDGDQVAVVALEGDHAVPRGHGRSSSIHVTHNNK